MNMNILFYLRLLFKNYEIVCLDKDLNLQSYIPYSKWNESNYGIINWPEDIEFCDYDKLESRYKIKVLDCLVNIKFYYKNL